MRITILSIFLFSCLSISAQSAHFRGEKGNGIFEEKNLLKEWPEAGPDSLLVVDGIGKGYSSVVVSGKTIYVSGLIDTLDYLTALDFEGNIKWQVPYGKAWMKSYSDSRCTPTIDGDRIYVISGMGRLVCINAKDGKEHWGVEVNEEFEAEYHRWGFAESILLVDDKVICSPVGEKTAVVAFDKMSGKLIWQSKSIGGSRSYVSPVLFEYGDFRYILAMSAKKLLAVDPSNGDIVWTYQYFHQEWTRRSSLNLTNSPIFVEDEIFLSKGYDYPAVMLKLAADGKSVTEKWMNETLDNHHGGFVAVDGYIYGSNWIHNRDGKWVCLDWETGEVKYEEEWENKGCIVYADGLLYCYEDKGGNVALVKPNPEKFELISSFKINKGSGPHWAHPWIKDGRLYMRHGDVLMVYDVSN